MLFFFFFFLWQLPLCVATLAVAYLHYYYYWYTDVCVCVCVNIAFFFVSINCADASSFGFGFGFALSVHVCPPSPSPLPSPSISLMASHHHPPDSHNIVNLVVRARNLPAQPTGKEEVAVRGACCGHGPALLLPFHLFINCSAALATHRSQLAQFEEIAVRSEQIACCPSSLMDAHNMWAVGEIKSFEAATRLTMPR